MMWDCCELSFGWKTPAGSETRIRWENEKGTKKQMQTANKESNRRPPETATLVRMAFLRDGLQTKLTMVLDDNDDDDVSTSIPPSWCRKLIDVGLRC
mmetsp:Transcript_25544/g.57075  ORF Transcript_25544/g.57075 Transcript_25544/m.57075 type:complete len:97 (+) Transcript_25544:1944-2234(+)